MPYGLPSGASLLNAAKSIDPEMLRTKILQNAELYEARSFCTTVRNCQSDSLDALLEHRKGHPEGRQAIHAAMILEKEQQAGNTINAPR